MNAFILAAGEGSRLRPYTEILPKPAIPFLNVPLFGYSFYLLKQFNISKYVMNMCHLSGRLQTAVSDWEHSPRVVHFSDESFNLLGSGGGIAKAKPELFGQGEFIALNGDEVILPKNQTDLLKFQQAYQQSKPLAMLLTMWHPEAGGKFGAVWVDKEQRVYGFGKDRPSGIEKDLMPMHFLGVQILSDRVFTYLPTDGEEANILYDGLKKGIAAGELVLSFPLDCHWFETGNIKDYLSATESCLKQLSEGGNEYLDQLLLELTPRSYLSVDAFGNYIYSASDVLVHRMQKFLVIGENVSFEKKPYFEAAVIEDGLTVAHGSYKNQILLRSR